MNEGYFAEVEKTLLYVSEARERAERAAKAIARDGADAHLVEALEDAERQLLAVHRRLMQDTYFAVPRHHEAQLALEASALAPVRPVRRLPSHEHDELSA